MLRAPVRTDEELMAAYVAGDRGAFQELFERYSSVLLRTMLRDLRSPEEAHDLVQQTFLQVHRARLDFDASLRFRPWVFTIALNLKREHFRRRRRRPESPLDEAIREVPVGATGQSRVDATRTLAWALKQLKDEQRLVIELHWFDGLSFPEVAQCVGITGATAKVRAHRGYNHLKQLLLEKAKETP